MKIALNLPIERKWLDMIASGQKREEYRAAGNAQVAKRWRDWYNHGVPCFPRAAVFRNGYNPTSPAVAVELLSITIRGREWQNRRHDWGEPGGVRAYFAIYLGKVLARGTYREVKAALEGEGAQ